VVTSAKGCTDTPVNLIVSDNTNEKHPCLDNGQTVLTRAPTQPEFVECWNHHFRTHTDTHILTHILGTHLDAIVTDNIECTVSFWWRGQGRRSWCFHHQNAKTSSRNLDINISWRCYRQMHRTTRIQWAFPYSVRLSGSRTRSLVSCAQCLRVSNTDLSMDGFTLEGRIGSIRS
jgi:hypothetical protein